LPAKLQREAGDSVAMLVGNRIAFVERDVQPGNGRPEAVVVGHRLELERQPHAEHDPAQVVFAKHSRRSGSADLVAERAVLPLEAERG